MKTIIHYTTENGKCPYTEWFETLDKSLQVKIEKRLEKIENHNHYGDCKVLAPHLSELRFTIGGGIRIYFTEIENTIVMLIGGGNKKDQSKSIAKAKEILKELEL